MKLKTKIILLVLLVAVTGRLQPRVPVAQAQTAQPAVGEACGNSSAVKALGSLDTGGYDVFVKLGHSDDIFGIKAYYQPFEAGLPITGACYQIADGLATGAAYTLLGALNLPDAINTGEVVLVADDPAQAHRLGMASMVFSPAEGAPCDLATGCMLDFNAGRMQLQPRLLSLASSELRLGYLAPLAGSTIEQVLYSVDNRPAYTRKELGPFNMRYVPNGQHTLGRTVFMNDGQVLQDSRTVQNGSPGQLHITMIATYYRYRTLINILFGLFVLPFAAFFLLLYIDSLRRRAKWRAAHVPSVNMNFKQEQAEILQALNAPAKEESALDVLLRYKWWWIGLGGAMVALLLTINFFATIFTVDGPSMEPTFSSGAKRVVVKAPVSFAGLNRSVYTPERGRVVVFRKTSSSLFDSSTQTSQYTVKRVVGLPGERVTVNGSVITVYRNGVAFVPDETEGWVNAELPEQGYVVDVVLGDGEIFVVGDNRMDSLDSRTYGPIRVTDVIGLAL